MVRFPANEVASFVDELRIIGRKNGVQISLRNADDEESDILVRKDNKMISVAHRHLPYAADLVNQFDYYFPSTVPTLIDGVQVVDYCRPTWHTLASGERFFYTSFAEDINATNDYMRYLRPNPGDVILDVGAYCGLSAVTFARAVGADGKVYAFEPDPSAFNALKLNIAEARVTNVVAKNIALSALSGELHFSSEGNMGSAISNGESNRGENVSIRSERLKDLVLRGDIDHFDVVKLDIEGAEYGVIEDSIDLIRNTSARWSIELHHDDEWGRRINVDRVRNIFDSLGYVSHLQQDNVAFPTLYAFPDNRFSNLGPIDFISMNHKAVKELEKGLAECNSLRMKLHAELAKAEDAVGRAHAELAKTQSEFAKARADLSSADTKVTNTQAKLTSTQAAQAMTKVEAANYFQALCNTFHQALKLAVRTARRLFSAAR